MNQYIVRVWYRDADRSVDYPVQAVSTQAAELQVCDLVDEDQVVMFDTSLTMSTQDIVVLDDHETWSSAAGACVVINAETCGSEVNTSSGRRVSIQELVDAWKLKRIAEEKRLKNQEQK